MVKEIGLYVLIKAFPGLVSLIIIPVIYRNLGAEVYGSFSIVQSFALLVIAFSSALSTQPIYRFYAGEKENKQKFISLTLLASVLAFGFFLMSSFFMGFTIEKIIIGTAIAFFGTIYSCFIVVAQVDTGPKPVGQAETMRTILYFGAALYICFQVTYVDNAEDFLLMAVALPFLLLSFWIYLKIRVNKEPIFSFSSLWLKQKIRYGVLTGLWIFVSGLPWFVNRWLIGEVHGFEAAGNYSSIHDLIYKAISIFTAATVMTVFPKLSELYHNADYENLDRTLNRSKKIYIAFAIVTTIGAVLVGSFAFSLILNIDVGILEILSLLAGVLIWQFGALQHKYLEFYERVDLMVCFVIIALIVHVTVLWALIERMGIFYSTGLSAIISGSTYLALVTIATLTLTGKNKLAK